MVETEIVSNGLEGIVVAETQISSVDGKQGRLIIKGSDAEVLAFASTFEETCGLLWSTADQPSPSRKELERRFAQGRKQAFALLEENQYVIRQDNAMDALRTATSILSGSTTTDIDEYIKLTAAIGVFASNWSRLKRGLPLLEPKADLSQAADFLRTLRDSAPSQPEVDALDTYLTTVSDHGMNASTFTARVVASTQSDNVSCVVAAIGALKGPLHGGAPGPVLEMLKAIGAAENADAWLRNEVASGRRIMGMGHRIYSVRDPRAAVFEQAIRKLEQAGLPAPSLALAKAVEQKAEHLLAELHPERSLKANVEFYTAVLLDALQIPHHLFSAVFAVGRVGGWCAHVAEQRRTGRLIRPASRYVGPQPR